MYGYLSQFLIAVYIQWTLGLAVIEQLLLQYSLNYEVTTSMQLRSGPGVLAQQE